jgi:predicted nuclease with TOPRIM domain
MDTTDIRLRVLETDVAKLRLESQESKVINAGIFEVLTDLRTEMSGIRTEMDKLRTGQDELRAGQDKLRTGQDELRAEMRTGHAELREELSVVKRSVGNLELSMKRVEGDVAELKAGHIELRHLVAGLVK